MRSKALAFPKGPFLSILILAVGFLLLWGPVRVSAETPVKKGHPKLDSALSELQEKYLAQGNAAAQAWAGHRHLRVDSQDDVVVFILPEGGKREAVDVAALRAFGGQVIKSGNTVIKARVPIGVLEKVATEVSGISFIKLPDRPLANVISQGVGLTGASSYHSSGYVGQNVKVAIIDLEFEGVAQAIAVGELPPSAVLVDCTGAECVGTGFGSETGVHGTACAEIVYDMAPGAQLYLIKVDDSIDLVHAKDYCIANGINVITHSVGWFNSNFYDGTCYFDNAVCSADHAYREGILWVNSAGNEGRSHYEATFSDRDGDLFHNVTSTSNFVALYAQAGDPIIAALTWDAWPVTDQDYDLYLLDSSLNVIAGGFGWQNGSQPPSEFVFTIAPVSGTYYLAVHKYQTAANYRFHIFSYYQDLDPYVSSSSLVSPADARGALAVAAIDWANWVTGPQETYSSQGPTSDGRLKPDVSGPDNVSSYSYGTFPGTSASSPHVAGAAALLLSDSPTLTVSGLWDAVTSMAVEMGTPGPDPVYGYGRLNLYTIYVYPASFDFGEVLVEGTSDRIITVQNVGAPTLAIGSITYPLAPYQVISDACSGQFLGLGQSCTVTVRFSPAARGTYYGSLEIPSNDPYRNPATVLLSGIGRHEVMLTSPPAGDVYSPCSVWSYPTFWWNATDPQLVKRYEIQFAPDPSFTAGVVKVQVPGHTVEKTLTPPWWRKVLRVRDNGGGPIYWRVIGTRSNGTKVTSDVGYFLVAQPQSVGNPAISPTNRAALPVLAWQNNCNVKFKVWFGSDPAFSTRRVFFYSSTVPSGGFAQQLAEGEWSSIKSLVDYQPGSTIYWYVESWDTLSRFTGTTLMSFVLQP